LEPELPPFFTSPSSETQSRPRGTHDSSNFSHQFMGITPSNVKTMKTKKKKKKKKNEKPFACASPTMINPCADLHIKL
jgi:hypothetical protein